MNAQKKSAGQRQPKGKGSSAAESGANTDERFSGFQVDPKFRPPSKRKAKTKVDKRFGEMLKDNSFTKTSNVDRYGRKVKSDRKKQLLQRLYEAEDDDEDEEEEEEERGKAGSGKRGTELDKDVKRELSRVEKKYDAARGGGFSESESDDDSSDDSDDSSSDENDSDDDSGRRAAKKKTKADQEPEQEEKIPTGEVTHRLAVVNLDWDKITSTDLMVLFSSFIPKESSGKIEKITIYPTRYGKEQLKREEAEGPAKEFFKSAKNEEKDEDEDDSEDSESSESEEDEENEEDEDDDDDDDSEDDDGPNGYKKLNREEDEANIDPEALRAYQISRLGYYYAVVVCSDKATAYGLYEATDGTEYQASSNFLDLRFLQNDVVFDDDDEPRDECSEVPKNYAPLDFSTDALQHSKVKLTWDTRPDDARRKDLINKAFTSTADELVDMQDELMAFVATDSESEEGDDEEGEGSEEQNGSSNTKTGNLSKKELKRRKMRSIFGFDEDSTDAVWGNDKKKRSLDTNLQITFTPALEAPKKSQKAAAAGPVEETAIEKYKRQEKERKEKRRQKAVAKREGRDPDAEDDEASVPSGPTAAADLGFDDPFFAEDPSDDKPRAKPKILKEERLKKRAQREAEEKANAEEMASLEKLMLQANNGDGRDGGHKIEHVDFRDIRHAEKERMRQERRDKRKGKKSKTTNAGGDNDQDEDDGVVDSLNDPRFKNMFETADHAIDPTNAEYEDLESTRKLRRAAERKRKAREDDRDNDSLRFEKKNGHKKAKTAMDAELASVVESIKRRAKKQAQ